MWAARRLSTLQRFDLRQLLFQSAQVIFGSLVWRSAHNHALDQDFLLRDQSFQLFQALDVVRHSRQRLALRACSLNAIRCLKFVAARGFHTPLPLQSSRWDYL
jgi:hypothetical protein